MLWALAAGTSAAAMAGTVHKVRFAQPAQILVWENGELIARGDRIALNDTQTQQAQALIGAGTLLPVAQQAHGKRTLAVASNTAFSVEAAEGTNVSIRVLGARENARAQVIEAHDATFRQAGKTAVRPGTPASQALELEITWSGDHPPALFLIAD